MNLLYFLSAIDTDSSIRILINSYTNCSMLTLKIYKFLPFRTMPDSTGYLFDKFLKSEEYTV